MIVRTPQGTNKSKSAGSLGVASTYAVGDLVVAILARDADAGAVNTQPGVTQYTFTKRVEANNAGNVVVQIWDWVCVEAGTAQVSFATSNDSNAIAVIVISGLLSSPFDKSSSGTGSGTSPSSGATATTSQADEILIGAVGTEGPVEDAAGTWSNSFNAGQRDGTTAGGAASNITISEGYLIVSATGAYTAAKTSITSRDWGAAIATYKATTFTPDLLGLHHIGQPNFPAIAQIIQG